MNAHTPAALGIFVQQPEGAVSLRMCASPKGVTCLLLCVIGLRDEKGFLSMRLTPAQHQTIMKCVREHAGEDVAVWLYGSRTQDDRRGGDVDLLVRSSSPLDIKQQAALHAELEEKLRLPVDISCIDARRGMTRFQSLVAARAVPLEAAR